MVVSEHTCRTDRWYNPDKAGSIYEIAVMENHLVLCMCGRVSIQVLYPSCVERAVSQRQVCSLSHLTLFHNQLCIGGKNVYWFGTKKGFPFQAFQANERVFTRRKSTGYIELVPIPGTTYDSMNGVSLVNEKLCQVASILPSDAGD